MAGGKWRASPPLLPDQRYGHGSAHPPDRRMDFDGPGSVAAPVDEIGLARMDALSEFADGSALVALVHKVEAITNWASGQGAEDIERRGRSDCFRKLIEVG